MEMSKGNVPIYTLTLEADDGVIENVALVCQNHRVTIRHTLGIKDWKRGVYVFHTPSMLEAILEELPDAINCRMHGIHATYTKGGMLNLLRSMQTRRLCYPPIVDGFVDESTFLPAPS